MDVSQMRNTSVLANAEELTGVGYHKNLLPKVVGSAVQFIFALILHNSKNARKSNALRPRA